MMGAVGNMEGVLWASKGNKRLDSMVFGSIQQASSHVYMTSNSDVAYL